VKGSFADEHIPRNLRLLLSIESGINDGIGLPMLFLPFFLESYPTAAQGFGYWLLQVWLYQVGVAVVLGVVLGYAVRKLLRNAHYYDWMDKEAFLALSVAIALMFLGIYARLGLDDLLGCFITGMVLSWDGWINTQLDGTHIQEVLDSLINISYFILFGTQIPWSLYGTVNLEWWRLLVSCVLLLLFRRLPAVLALWKWIPALHSWEEAFFCGWFGPMGVGALGYALASIVQFNEPQNPIFPIVSAIVLSSVIIHSGSVGLFHIGLVRSRTLEQSGAIVVSYPSNLTISGPIVRVATQEKEEEQ
jgi:NhaP-type Na+/H+ or K+/H+ antiporter